MAVLLTQHPTTIPFRLCTSPAVKGEKPPPPTLTLLAFMKKIRGFRLGKRLVRLCRWVWWPRPRRTAYLRLRTTPPSSSPRSPPRRLLHHHDKERTEMSNMIADWGRRVTRRLCQTTHVSFGSIGGGGGGESSRHPLLGDEHRLSDHGKPQPPPKGHLVVYVGRKGVDPLYRVLVPVVYFNHPLFGELLREAEEEFGFHQPGGITIPCPISDFESVRTRVAAAAGVGCRHCSRPTGWAGGH